MHWRLVRGLGLAERVCNFRGGVTAHRRRGTKQVAARRRERDDGEDDRRSLRKQMVAEVRALRASAVRLWTAQQKTLGPDEVEELIRFNEAVDQAVAESLARYSSDIGEMPVTATAFDLLGGAVKHGDASATINVDAPSDAGHTIIAGHSGGPAIPAENLDGIFDGLKTGADDHRDRRHLGLRLFIVEKSVEAHGGTIDVQSTAESGTTFTIRLPRAPRAHYA